MTALDTTTNWVIKPEQCQKCNSPFDPTFVVGDLCVKCVLEEIMIEASVEEVVVDSRKNWPFQHRKVLYTSIAKQQPEPKARAPPHMRR